MSPWWALGSELALWRAAGQRATFWCRDDDASHDSPALQRLLGIAERAALPIAVAAIPATLERSLVEAVMRSKFATVIQHGYAHRDHATANERKIELGLHSDIEETLADLARGAEMLRRGFSDRFLAVLVPPWNRIAAPIVARLPAVGFVGLSTLGARTAQSPVPGLTQCNAHVDVIAWRRDRTFIGVEAAIERALAHLRARRESGADPDEATGVLTHHLDMSNEAWDFLIELVDRTREHGGVWIDVEAAFGVAGRAPTTCGRSA